MFINVEAGETDDRRYTLNIQSAEVVAVSDEIKDIYPGDIALLDYLVSVDNEKNLIEKTDDYELRCINAVTTIHKEDQISYANRKTRRDQIIARKGEYDIISPVLGVIRGDELIARNPYIFLEHESNVKKRVSAAGLLYEEIEMVYERRVLSSGCEDVEADDILILSDFDVFHVKAGERKLDVVFSRDVKAKKELAETP